MANVVFTDPALDDFNQLDGSAKLVVAKGLKKLEDSPESRGEPLGSRKLGNLTGLRKLVVGNRTYRIVYKVEENDTICVVLVIAGRADDECYDLAVGRLNLYAQGRASEVARTIIDTAFGKS